jgi:hypothetical protein
MAQRLIEGEKRITDLPCPPTGQCQMIEQMQFGLHSIEIQKMGITASKVYVRDYTHWQHAFDAAMDKAGL